MKDYIQIVKIKESKNISICFYITDKKIFNIGEKMKEINENAYMNGYNWEAFFEYYLAKYYPDVYEEMGHDPEANMYVAFYEKSPANEKKAEKLVEIIEDLVENESKLYEIVKNEGTRIEWD